MSKVEEKKGLGRALINWIIKDGLVTSATAHLSVWKSNAEEVLEAIVEDWEHNSRFCEACENHVLIGGVTDPEGIFVCNDCLPSEGDDEEEENDE